MEEHGGSSELSEAEETPSVRLVAIAPRAPLRGGDWSRALLATQAAVDAAADDLDAVINAVTEGALKVVAQADGALTALREGERLWLRGASGRFAEAPRLALRTDHSLAGRTIIEGKAQLCRDTWTDPRVDRAACTRLQVRSILSVPLRLQGIAIGAFQLLASRPDAFDSEDILTAELLAGALMGGMAAVAHGEVARANAEANKRFSATFEQAAVGIAHVTPDGRFLLVNERFCAITGYDRDELVAGGFQQITYADDLETDLEHVADLLHGRTRSYAMEKRYIRKDGKLVWVNLTVSLVRNEDGSPDFFVSVVEDISSRKAAEREAMHDPLTGLLNRRGLVERLDRILKRRRSGEQPFTVAYLDLDGFKAINDRHGHGVGDRCLASAAEAMRAVLRAEDLLARPGGDEFVALLPSADGETAGEVLARLQGALASATIDGKPDLSLQASIGAVVVPAGLRPDPGALVSAADALMYRAKRERHTSALIAPFFDRPTQP